ncbi:MAG: DUF3108 domain-containing protein [Candidatus Omnitrophica bacterium]|nr:DUF3108 domain-containing protein [Candidatus Omnitrophota bacterium]MDD5352442.1 DUF3108 domain-containing protein [Candidatus Omnitrophota bacterium]MDD5550040.1 DUF3108 domain-containing protein [Candidatus Omnitrophota bacterium]
MIKRLFLGLAGVVVIVVLADVVSNTYKSNPELIAKNLKKEIEATQINQFKTYQDWLWQLDRTFVFDVIYMNIFSPGTAKMHVAGETNLNNTPVYIMEATVELSTFLKKMYDAKMVISDAVAKDTKIPLWYREESYTPENNKSKEIVFDPQAHIAAREGIKFKIPPYTHDPLSAFFNLLDKNYVLGETITLNLLTKEEVYAFNVTPVELKNNIYKLNGEVHRSDKSSAHGAKFTLWVRNGKVRVPLMIKVVSAGGPIYLRLKAIK